MASLTLDSDNRTQLMQWLNDDAWVVACLCAAWCDTCCAYRSSFDALAARHPDKRFVWIDIEDEADLVGDFEVENFPTLLIQRSDAVAFFGTVLPDINIAHRLIQVQTEKDMESLRADAASTAERRNWQQEYNLHTRLAAHLNNEK